MVRVSMQLKAKAIFSRFGGKKFIGSPDKHHDGQSSLLGHKKRCSCPLQKALVILGRHASIRYINL